MVLSLRVIVHQNLDKVAQLRRVSADRLSQICCKRLGLAHERMPLSSGTKDSIATNRHFNGVITVAACRKDAIFRITAYFT